MKQKNRKEPVQYKAEEETKKKKEEKTIVNIRMSYMRIYQINIRIYNIMQSAYYQ